MGFVINTDHYKSKSLSSPHASLETLSLSSSVGFFCVLIRSVFFTLLLIARTHDYCAFIPNSANRSSDLTTSDAFFRTTGLRGGGAPPSFIPLPAGMMRIGAGFVSEMIGFEGPEGPFEGPF